MVRPSTQKNINWTSVIQLANNLLNIKDYDNSDIDYLHIEVMKTVFGKDVFNYINN